MGKLPEKAWLCPRTTSLLGAAAPSPVRRVPQTPSKASGSAQSVRPLVTASRHS